MKSQLVYDLPTRVFHWLFAGSFLTAFIIAKTIEDDSPIYSYHMLAGLTLSFLVLMRIIWGFVGTKHARFSSLALSPSDLVSYFRDLLTGGKKRWAGHNPASSWAGLIMMALALGSGITGYLMTSGPDKEAFEDIHELFANGFIIVVGTHILGIIVHTLRHKEMIALSMIDGKKVDIPEDQVIPSARPVFGVLMIVLVLSFGLNLFKNYDSQNRTLQIFGATLQLGENENRNGESEKENSTTEHKSKDDDNDD